MTNRALVLGGGGPVGIAWEAGLLAGLKEAGLNAADATLILGTSAGSFVGAQLAGGRDPIQLADAQTAPPPPSSESAPRASQAEPPNTIGLQKIMLRGPAPNQTEEQFRAEIGAFARSAKTIPPDQFIASFGSLGAKQRPWPSNFACTAVDADSGAFKTWRAEDGVPLALAIASSCSVPGIYPPIDIAGRTWIDGGMRSSTNADGAAGHARVLIVAVVTPERAALAKPRLEKEIAAIEAKGGKAEVVFPDGASVAAFGPNMMDSRRRPDAALAGRQQGRAEAARLAAFWS